MSSSDASQPADGSSSAKTSGPTRSPAERMIVRGGIGLLLVVVAIELSSYARQLITKSLISSEIEKSEASDYRVTQEKINDLFWGRKPDVTHTVKAPAGDERFDAYYFDGLLKRRELWVHYGIEGKSSAREVVGISVVTPEEVLSL